VLSSADEDFSITDSTDYDALTSRIAVLSVALSGIESYVAEESTLRKLAQAPEGSPRKREPVPLEQIRTRLDAIHGKICTSALHDIPVPWLICRFRLPSQLTRVPPTSIDLEPKELYNASRCAYIINVQPFPRREGNYAWATFSALAVSLDNRSVETLTGRSPYCLSLILHIHIAEYLILAFLL
jgi:hypothetical protein